MSTRSFPKQCPCREHHPDGRPCGKRDPLAELLAAALEGANWVEIATDSEEWPSATLADMNACIVRLRAAVAAFDPEGKKINDPP